MKATWCKPQGNGYSWSLNSRSVRSVFDRISWLTTWFTSSQSLPSLQVYDVKDPDLHHIRNIMRSYYHEITPSRWGIITLSESALFGGILPWLGEFRILELWTFFVYAYPSQKKIASIWRGGWGSENQNRSLMVSVFKTGVMTMALPLSFDAYGRLAFSTGTRGRGG